MGEWRRVRIGDFLHRAKSPVSLRDDEEYQLVTVRMHHKGVTLREKKKGKLIGSNMYRVKAGQFILSGIDARHGAFGVVPEELDGAIVTNDFWYFDVDDAVVSRDFFLWLTTTPLFLDACIKSSEGTTNRRRLQAEKFFNFSFNFPGISEQHRLAERFIAFDKTHTALKDEFEIQTAHFKQLRQAVLQEAVEGKLTADWRKQHPLVKGDPQHDAAALLAQIKAEKERLVKVGKIRREKSQTRVRHVGKAFEQPPGWVVCAMGEIIYCYRGHNPPKCDFKYEPQEGYVRFVQITDFKTDDKAVFVPKARGLKYVKYGEIVMAAYRHIGKISREVEGAFNVALCKIVEVNPMDRDFVERLIGTSFVKGELLKASHRTHIPSMHTDHLLSLNVPLPPLAEQQAIVARVDSLMATIDDLEAQVTERKDQAQQLMQAVLREAFAGGEGAVASVGANNHSPSTATRQLKRANHDSPLRKSTSKIRAGLEPAPTVDLPIAAEAPAVYRKGGQAALPAANQPVPGGIPGRILAAMTVGRDYSRADLLAATGIREADWTWAIRQLKEQKKVKQAGEKRGARYSRK